MGTTNWTTESLTPGTTYAYRVVPLRYWMTGQAGPAVTFTVPKVG